MARKNSFLSVEVDEQTSTLNFHFPTLGKTYELQVSGLSPHIQSRLALHGAEQKLRDSVAAPDGTEPADRLARFERVFESLISGQWTVRKSAEPTEEPIETLARALATVMTAAGRPRNAEDLLPKLRTMNRSERARIRAIPEVAAEIARIKGKGASVADLDL